MKFGNTTGDIDYSGESCFRRKKNIAGSEEGLNTPILLLVFNRPEPTAKILAAVRRVRPARLYIAADGPRESHPEDSEKVAEVREIIKKIDWPCRVRKMLRDKNAGCKYGVSGAISWFFENEEEGIILEDDTLPDQRFFSFAEKALNHARRNEKIGAVCGYNILGESGRDKPFLAAYPHIWGWATWRRVWREYQADIDMNETDMRRIINEHIKNKKVAAKLGKIGTLNRQGRFNSWDFQLAFLLCRRKLLSIYPPVNLIRNIGFGSDATHTANGLSAPLYPDSECSCDFNELRFDPEYDKQRFKIDFPGRITLLKKMLAARLANFTETAEKKN